MQFRLIPGAESRDGWSRGQDLDLRGWTACLGIIPMWSKSARGIPDQQVGMVFVQDERPIGQIQAIGHVPDLLTGAGHAGLVQQTIDLKVSHWTVCLCPCRFEAAISVWAAIGARAMSCGKAHGFIQEKQRRPSTFRHRAVIPSFGVGQIADDPVLMLPARHAKPPHGEGQDAAVSGEHPAGLLRHDLARGQNAVLQGRGAWRAHGSDHHFLGGRQS